jgi:MFS family permease
MLVMGSLGELIGRKKSIGLAALLMTLGVAVIVLSSAMPQIIAGRFLTGLACGMITLTVPLYLAESVPSASRGRATVAFQLFLTFGILMASFISWLLPPGSWRMIFGLELIPTTSLLIVSVLIPESPCWLNKKEAPAPNVSMDRRYLPALALGVALICCNQLTGINAFLQYDSTILLLSGLGEAKRALFGSILIAGTNFIFTALALCFVDRIERKKLLQTGLIGIICCLTAAVFALNILKQGPIRGTLVACSLFAFFACFAVAPGALVWTITAEILPSAIRNRGLSIALFCSSLVGATFTTLFLPLQERIGLGGIFSLCIMSSGIYLAASCLIPRTTHRSLEEIEKELVTKMEAA